MGLQSIVKDFVVKRVANDAVAGTTAVTTSAIDMSGYDSVCFVAAVGDVTATSVLTLTAYGNDTNANSGGAAITGAATGAVTAGATDTDNKLFVVDVLRPAKRYVYATLTRATANAVVDGIIAILYNSRTRPVTVDSSVAASVFVAAQ